jgi:uncharacterized protein YjiS (DUF1127 family)
MNHSPVLEFTPANRRYLGILTRIGRIARVFETIDTWRLRQRTRRHLARVDARTLQDVGISEVQRIIELNKPFWEK